MEHLQRNLLLFALLFSLQIPIFSQSPTQILRGQVLDRESQSPLAGARIMVIDSTVIGGAISDENGQFRVENLPIGRHGLQVTFLGYEPLMLGDVTLTSGKEKVLRLEMTEAITELETVEITAEDDKHKPLNEMATVSARSFSLEEAKRYPAATFDPARMAQNYAGVVSAGFDMNNDIVIRGNSPRYMQWRLEGIPIPNPNHFGGMGSSGGPISMLSSSTLANSDFYTGAFPAEYGDALSGVFDLRFRRGNNEKREFSFMIGGLGVEASTEGYFSKKSKASYLVNYRYSTLALMGSFVPSLDGVLPVYQDLSFYLNIPTEKAGTFSVFGLGGTNVATEQAEADSSLWDSEWDAVSYKSWQQVGVAGLSHKYLLGEKTYMKSVVAVSADNYGDESYRMLPEQNYAQDTFDLTTFENYAFRLHSYVNHKFNARHTLRAGIQASNMDFSYRYDNKDWDDGIWRTYLKDSGNTTQLEPYAQWKYRMSQQVTLNAGFHGTFLTLNSTWAIDPRAAIQWQAAPSHRLSLALGLHSKPEHPSTYFLTKEGAGGVLTTPNRDLEMSRALHLVAGYDWQISADWHLKLEAYYQHLFQLPISTDTASTFSIVNSNEIWDLVDVGELSNDGLGRNMGLDLTLEKYFSEGYFCMLTGSVYDSRYLAPDGNWYSTRFNGNYNMTVMGGKEFKLGKNKKNALGINAKLVASGGSRFTPIDLAASGAAGREIRFEKQAFEAQSPAYIRPDLGFSYTINARKVTHTILLDIQNVVNRRNIFVQYYDSNSNTIESWDMNGLFPFFNYRIEF